MHLGPLEGNEVISGMSQRPLACLLSHVARSRRDIIIKARGRRFFIARRGATGRQDEHEKGRHSATAARVRTGPEHGREQLPKNRRTHQSLSSLKGSKGVAKGSVLGFVKETTSNAPIR